MLINSKSDVSRDYDGWTGSDGCWDDNIGPRYFHAVVDDSTDWNVTYPTLMIHHNCC